jgi:hypothetical protein
LNPSHGQPGHRCDIAVGALLNSGTQSNPANIQPVTSTTVPQVPSTPVAVNKAVAGSSTTAGLNPAHGQPGHRCDIPVGASLNSKPNTTQVTPTVQSVSSTAQSTTAPGMNPAHGQPGHRCDISVGAPLNSKAVEQVNPAAKDTSGN